MEIELLSLGLQYGFPAMILFWYLYVNDKTMKELTKAINTMALNVKGLQTSFETSTKRGTRR